MFRLLAGKQSAGETSTHVRVDVVEPPVGAHEHSEAAELARAEEHARG